MELNTKQIKEIKQLLGDKKFNEIVNGFNYDADKIYLYKGVGSDGYYKMHNTNGTFSFVHLNSSVCHSNGYFEDSIECLKSCDDVRVFNSIQEAFKSGYFK